MPEAPTHAAAPSRTDRRWWRDVPPWVWPLLALVVLVACIICIEQYRFGTRNFLKPENLLNILNQQSYVGVVAIGMTFVIICAGIDLSVGSMLAMLGVLGLLAANRTLAGGGGEGVAVALAFAAMLGGGAVAGTVNGLLVSMGRIAPFIVTLGGFAAFRSIALTAARSGEIRYDGGNAFSWIGTSGLSIPGTNIAGPFATTPLPLRVTWGIVIFLVAAILGWILLNRTRFGRYAVAIGANERAAVYSAVPVRTIKTLVYALMGSLVGLAAIMSTSRMNSVGSGGAGVMLELDAIAAVVVGGTRLSGGRGTIAGTVLGVLILGAISNMLVMLNINSNLQGLVKGVVIVLAVLIQKKA
jgi:ribose transport system permease protein